MLEFAQYLNSDLVFDAPELTTRQELFQFVAKELKRKGIVTEPERIVQKLEAREAAGPTSVGYGIALPHITLQELDRILIVVVRLREPLDWQALDQKPVKVAFFILAPEAEKSEYIKVLGSLATRLRRKGIVKSILEQTSPTNVVNTILSPIKENFFYRNRHYIYYGIVIIISFLVFRYILPKIVLPTNEYYVKLDYLKFNSEPWLTRQVLAITVFLATVIGTLLFWRHRVAIAAFGLGVLLLSGTMDIETTVRFMSIPTILFIMAMMGIISWLSDLGLFRFLVVWALKKVKGSPALALLLLMFFSLILGAFTGEVTAILVTMVLGLEITRRTRVSPFIFLVSLVFATNVGSSLTLVGNPIGVYLAFAGKLTFEDFLRWATPTALIAAIFVVGLCLFGFRNALKPKKFLSVARFDDLDEWAEVIDRKKFRIGWILFVLVILLIILHNRIELLLNLVEGTVLVAAPLCVLGIIVFTEKERGKFLIERGVDWWTLIFFMFLFAKAACLEFTGVTPKFAHLVSTLAQKLPLPNIGGGVTGSALVMLLWGSGITSGFVDNLPIVAALVPIVKDLSRIGVAHSGILWWALLFGGCLGGNLTMIGSTANIVAVSTYERDTGRTIRFRQWLLPGVIVTITSMLIATIILLLQIPLSP
uniref:PTS EIIA type-2 domain-containing protein n=1 Tax=candidate division WOR-3 bacterium TaxID=2052148 RepID=A0A7C6A9I8_UNCW3